MGLGVCIFQACVGHAEEGNCVMHFLFALVSSIDAFTPAGEMIASFAKAFPGHTVETARTESAFLARLSRAEAVVCWRFERAWYERAPRLKMIFTPAAGNDWVARDPAGTTTVYHGSFHGAVMAETLLGMILYFNRRFETVVSNQRAHRWERNYLSGARRLRGQHILIIGYGAIGRWCARLLRAMGCTITGMKRSDRDERLDCDAHNIIDIDLLGAVLPGADHVVLALPGGPETDGLITREHFDLMNSSAYLYNLGRGNCYAEAELIQALRQRSIAGAGLDVFAREPLDRNSALWDMPNVLILPHASAISAEYMPLFFEQLCEWVRKV